MPASAATQPSAARAGFVLRKLSKPEEFRAAEELQREAAGMDGETPTAATVQRAAQDNGGMVLGAFVDIYLAGVTIGFLGWDERELYHFAHVIAVRPAYQNHHVGFQLGAYLREEVLGQGLPRVRWNLDPLQSRAAHLGVRRLGGKPDRYLTHYFGQLDSSADRGVETDRLRVTWDLAAPRTEARVAGKLPTEEEDRARFARSVGIVATDLTNEGLRRPTEVAEPDGREAHLEIPFDIAAVREHAPGALRTWRHAVRDGFRAGFDLGYVVDDFVVLKIDQERRAFYLLARAPPDAGAGSSPAAPPLGAT